MLVATKLIREFSTRTVLPVDVNDVVKFFIENGIQDEIEFIAVDFDPEILLGQAKRFIRRDKPYGNPIFCTNIYYHRGATKDLQRMICCKELLHIPTPEWGRAKTREEILSQAEKIGLPPGLQDFGNDGAAANLDRLAEFQAIGVLFPMAARQLLIPPLKNGALTLDDIARIADLPKAYVGVAMSDQWESTYKIMTQL